MIDAYLLTTDGMSVRPGDLKHCQINFLLNSYNFLSTYHFNHQFKSTVKYLAKILSIVIRFCSTLFWKFLIFFSCLYLIIVIFFIVIFSTKLNDFSCNQLRQSASWFLYIIGSSIPLIRIG